MKRTVALLIAGMGLVLTAGSASAALDNYQCYKSKDLKNPKFAGTTQPVSDQFLSGNVDIKKPGMVCAPASVNGSGLIDAATHLNCYKVKGPKGAGANAQLADQFGTVQVAVKGKAAFVCVPATKTIIP
jgi:hypothetical protein